MTNLSKRSYTPELMDADHIPFEAIAQTLKELNVINRRLGGHATTLSGVKSLSQKNRPALICEIGCGGGDNLNAIYDYCLKNKVQANFIGIDKNPECLAFAQQQYPDLPCQWICSDYAQVNFDLKKPDIIFSSLFCHHFTDEQLVFMLQWMRINSRTGFFINDLHRHWLAFYLIKYITRYFSKSYLVRNDASLSVARSFREDDWKKLMQAAGIGEFQIVWRWAFRFLVVHKNKHHSAP
jgi:ubiquinone/menaquinone biosynthesis C-methylase UbiE